MPSDCGLGLEEDQCRPPIVPQLREADLEDSIGPAEMKLASTARALALKDQKLTAEGKNLCLQNEARSETVSGGRKIESALVRRGYP